MILSSHFSRLLSSSRFQVIFSLGICLLLSVHPGQAQDDLCSRSVGGLAGLPTIDGIVHGEVTTTATNDDPGWAPAAQVNLNAGEGANRTARLYLGHTSNDVYLGIVSENPSPDKYTTIVLAISPTNDPTEDWRIHIRPFDDPISPGTAQDPSVVQYWRNSGGWNDSGTGPTVPAATDWLAPGGPNIKFSNLSGSSAWSLELRIPRDASSSDGIEFPSGSTFQMYLNVVSTDQLVPSNYSEAEYPGGSVLDVPATGITPITEATPPTDVWGEVSLGSRSECEGVTIDWDDIGVRGTSPHTIEFASPSNCSSPGTTPTGPTNTFFAEPYTTDGTASDVTALFRRADWGIPGRDQWTAVPTTSGSNPTTLSDVNTSGPVSPGNWEMDWQLSEEEACTYQSNPHQCLQVELDSDEASTHFLRRGVTRNMDFVSASTFERSATIGGTGWGEPLENANTHEMLLKVSSVVQPLTRTDEGFEPIGRSDRRGETNRERGETNRETGPDVQVDVPDSLRFIDGGGFLGVDRVSPEFYEGGITQGMTWFAFGYLLRPGQLSIEQETFQKTELVGGFGFFAGHDGDVEEWSADIDGNTVHDTDGESYLVEVPVGESVDLNVSVEADEGGCFNDDESSSPTGIILFVGLIVVGLVAYRRRRRT